VFKWLSAEHTGLAGIRATFDEMVGDARHAFQHACASALGEADPAAVHDDVVGADRRVNARERTIRQRLLVHMVVHAKGAIPVALKWMSIVKDAERIGDQAKNIYDLGRVHPTPPDDAVYADLAALRGDVLAQLADLVGIFDPPDEPRAQGVVDTGRRVLAHCDERLMALVRGEAPTERPVDAALLYRHVKRVSAHAMNIAAALLLPLDRLDMWDEDEETRGPDEP